MLVALLPSPPPAGVALYAHVGGKGGGGDGGGGDGGGGDGGAAGGSQSPSQSTMYSTYTKLPSYAFSSTAGVAVVTKVYVPSGLIGNGACLTHSNVPSVTTVVIVAVVVIVDVVGVDSYVVSDEELDSVEITLSLGVHLPCTSSPLAVVLTTYSSSSSKSVFLTVTVR